jgi:hypothetical protein
VTARSRGPQHQPTARSGRSQGGKTLILHWNGIAWKQVPSPASAAGGEIVAVAAPSAQSAWAVGESSYGDVILQRWNGTAWK